MKNYFTHTDVIFSSHSKDAEKERNDVFTSLRHDENQIALSNTAFDPFS